MGVSTLDYRCLWLTALPTDLFYSRTTPQLHQIKMALNNVTKKCFKCSFFPLTQKLLELQTQKINLDRLGQKTTFNFKLYLLIVMFVHLLILRDSS